MVKLCQSETLHVPHGEARSPSLTIVQLWTESTLPMLSALANAVPFPTLIWDLWLLPYDGVNCLHCYYKTIFERYQLKSGCFTPGQELFVGSSAFPLQVKQL